MKNLIILVFSVFMLYGCTEKNNKNLATAMLVSKQDSILIQSPDSDIVSKLDYIQTEQAGVSDTSHTSLIASYATAQDVANKIDDEAFKSSQYLVLLHKKNKKAENLLNELDSLNGELIEKISSRKTQIRNEELLAKNLAKY